MFTRQRRNYRIFVYAALIVTLCILVAALMWPKDSAPAGSDEIKSENEANADSQAGDQDGSDNNGGSGQNAGGISINCVAATKITTAASQHQKTTTEIRIRMTRIKTTINLWYPGQRTHIM